MDGGAAREGCAHVGAGQPSAAWRHSLQVRAPDADWGGPGAVSLCCIGCICSGIRRCDSMMAGTKEQRRLGVCSSNAQEVAIPVSKEQTCLETDSKICVAAGCLAAGGRAERLWQRRVSSAS